MYIRHAKNKLARLFFKTYRNAGIISKGCWKSLKIGTHMSHPAKRSYWRYHTIKLDLSFPFLFIIIKAKTEQSKHTLLKIYSFKEESAHSTIHNNFHNRHIIMNQIKLNELGVVYPDCIRRLLINTQLVAHCWNLQEMKIH